MTNLTITIYAACLTARCIVQHCKLFTALYYNANAIRGYGNF